MIDLTQEDSHKLLNDFALLSFQTGMEQAKAISMFMQGFATEVEQGPSKELAMQADLLQKEIERRLTERKQ